MLPCEGIIFPGMPIPGPIQDPMPGLGPIPGLGPMPGLMPMGLWPITGEGPPIQCGGTGDAPMEEEHVVEGL